jgi:hypothetical protein
MLHAAPYDGSASLTDTGSIGFRIDGPVSAGVVPSAFTISVGSDATKPDRLRITSSGKVGIGTTNPQGRLDVNGPIYQRGGVLHADYVFKTAYKMESPE